jgi:hypothetical protein
MTNLGNKNELETNVTTKSIPQKSKEKGCKDTIWKRNCPNFKNNPNCQIELYYGSKLTFTRQQIKNGICRSCINFTRKHSETEKKTRSERMMNCGNHFYGKKHSTESTKKMGQRGKDNHQFGKSGYWMGKSHSAEYRLNMSKSKKVYSDENFYNSRVQRWHFYNWINGNLNGFEKYIGLSLNEFKLWISHQFNENMSWNNYGIKTWHIDHRYPLCRFNLITDSKKAWNFKNLRPLSAKENQIKNSKIICQ